MSILVCGDAMTDRYWFGDVRRISPEAPVPVLAVDRIEERQGAAANVASNVRAMGASCSTAFSPGGDPVLKIRLIGKSQQMLRADFDSPQEPVSPRLQFGDARVVIFSDYGKGALAHVQTLIFRAKMAGLKVLVDPKGYDYERYRYADVVKPNLDEMRVMVGGWKNENDLTDKAQAIRKKAHIGALLLTRAADGMSLYSDEGVAHIGAEAREVFDVTGAGDTAIAALAVAMLEGRNLLEAATIANRAAGIACTRFGTATVTREEAFGAR